MAAGMREAAKKLMASADARMIARLCVSKCSVIGAVDRRPPQDGRRDRPAPSSAHAPPCFCPPLAAGRSMLGDRLPGRIRGSLRRPYHRGLRRGRKRRFYRSRRDRSRVSHRWVCGRRGPYSGGGFSARTSSFSLFGAARVRRPSQRLMRVRNSSEPSSLSEQAWSGTLANRATGRWRCGSRLS